MEIISRARRFNMRTWKKYFNEFLIDDIANGNVYVMVREYPKYYPEILRIFIPSSAKVYNAKDFIIQSIKNGSIKDCIEAIKHFRGETKVKENADGSFITIKFLHKDSLRRIYQNPNRKYKIIIKKIKHLASVEGKTKSFIFFFNYG